MPDSIPTPLAAPPPLSLKPRRPARRKASSSLPQPGFMHYFWAAFGSVLMGVTLPCVLVGVRVSLTREFHEDTLLKILVLEAVATAGCGPGAIILSLAIMALMTMKTVGWTQRRSILIGALAGAVMAFVNLPGYGVLMLLWEDAWPLPRVMLLFIVAGSTCGMWIGWQAWRGFRPGTGFLPRFTLKTLLLLVFLWGTVMIAFQPDRERNDVWVSPQPDPIFVSPPSALSAPSALPDPMLNPSNMPDNAAGNVPEGTAPEETKPAPEAEGK